MNEHNNNIVIFLGMLALIFWLTHLSCQRINSRYRKEDKGGCLLFGFVFFLYFTLIPFLFAMTMIIPSNIVNKYVEYRKELSYLGNVMRQLWVLILILLELVCIYYLLGGIKYLNGSSPKVMLEEGKYVVIRYIIPILMIFMGINLLYAIFFYGLSISVQMALGVVLLIWIAFVVYYIKLVIERKIGNQMSFGSDKGIRAVDEARFNSKK